MPLPSPVRNRARVPACRRRRAAPAAFALAVALAAGTAAAAPVDPGRSRLGFGFSQMNVPGEGEFKRFSGEIRFDPAQPGAGLIDFTIELATVDAGSSDANEVLRSPAFFDVARHPQARFRSTAIRPDGAGRFVARGDLQLKGRSTELEIPFAVRSDGAGQWLEGSVPVSRLALRVGEGEWADLATVADRVQVRFRLLVPRP